MERVQAFAGLFGILAIAWLLSEDRGRVSGRQVVAGFAASFVTAIVFLKVPFVAQAFGLLNAPVEAVAAATRAGTAFVFGYLGGGALPFAEPHPGAAFVLALQALPIVLVMSALTTLLGRGPDTSPSTVRDSMLLPAHETQHGGAIAVLRSL